MGKHIKILLVEDSENDAALLLRELKHHGYEVEMERVDTPETMDACLAKPGWDIIISDYRMPRFSGPEALSMVRKKNLDIPFILISGTIGEEVAVEAMRTGVNDYILKNSLARLAPAIERELREAEERQKRRAAEEALKKSEAQLLQSQKMEAIGRLAGGVAHDFNNLLTAISGYSELILKDMNEQDPFATDLNEIKKCAERATSLTRQLLAFSRKQILQPRVLNINSVVTDMNRMFKRLIGEDIHLVSALEPKPKLVMADPGQMEQVIMNLVVNARDAMPQGGTLTLETANTELKEQDLKQFPEVKPGQYVLLTVKDTGTGMTEEILTRIFEPFFTTKGIGKGTGLGLATVYGIVKQSDGHINVKSKLGHGTTFQIYLPIVQNEVAQAAPEPTESLQSVEGTETVLLVEDEDVVRELARRALAKHGYKIIEAANAGEALLITERHKGDIHILLTDVIMPRLNGYELAQRLIATLPELKVLYMTGHAEPDVLKDITRSGRPFITKPFRPQDLLRKIRNLLDGPAVN